MTALKKTLKKTNAIKFLIVVFVLVLNCQAEKINTTPDEVVEAALAASVSKSASQAIPLLANAEKKYPFHSANVEVLYQLANAYLEVGSYKQALEAFDIFLARYGKYEDSLSNIDEAKIGRAKALAGQGEEDEALDYIKTFLAARPNSEARDAAYVEMATIYMKNGKYDKAEKLLIPLAKDLRSPMRDPAMFLMAEITIKKGNEDQTEALMKNLVKNAKTKETKINALFKLGDIYRANSNYVKAIDAYRRIKAGGQGADARELNSGILFEIATTFENLGHPLEARIGFEKISEFYPELGISTVAWHRSIMSYADYDDYGKAEKKYLAYIKKHPKIKIAEDLRLYMAQRLMQQEKYDETIKQLQAGVVEYPNGDVAENSYHTLGVALLAAKRYEEARKALESFAVSFPDSPLVPESFEYLAEGYIEQDQYQAAIDTLVSLIAKFPNSISGTSSVNRLDECYIMYGDTLVATNDIDGAIAQYRKVKQPKLQEQALMLECDTFSGAERYQEAIASSKQFIEKYPESKFLASVYLNMGAAQIQFEEYEAAEKSLDKISDLGLSKDDPILPISKLQKAFCRYYLGDQVGMSNVLGGVVQSYPGTDEAGEALYWIGYLHRSAGAYYVAADVYKKLAEEYSNHGYAPEAQYLIGECYMSLNDIIEAGANLTKTFEKFPESGYGLYALVRGASAYTQMGLTNDWQVNLDNLKQTMPAQNNEINVALASMSMYADKKDIAKKIIAKVKLEQLPLASQGVGYAIRAGIERMNNNVAQASQDANQALAISMENQVGQDLALYQMGMVLMAQKEWESAVEIYTELTENISVPDQKLVAKAIIDLAQCYLELGQYEMIVELCDKAIKMRPYPDQAARAVLIKGDAMYQSGDYNKAAQYYKRCTILYEGYDQFVKPAYIGLIEAYKKLGLSEDLAATEKQYNQLFPNK